MKGAEDLIRLRMAGKRPVAAFILDYPAGRFAGYSVARQLQDGSIPALYVDQDEPALADCRFLVGIPVHLHSDDAARAAAWVDRLLTDGVPVIYQSNSQGEFYQWQQ